MTNFKKGEVIFLTTHNRMSMPNHWEIIEETLKGIKLQNDVNGKSIWLPKSVIKWDSEYREHFLVEWFRKKMPNWQFSILQG